jgi:hypothetical protein
MASLFVLSAGCTSCSNAQNYGGHLAGVSSLRHWNQRVGRTLVLWPRFAPHSLAQGRLTAFRRVRFIHAIGHAGAGGTHVRVAREDLGLFSYRVAHHLQRRAFMAKSGCVSEMPESCSLAASCAGARPSPPLCNCLSWGRRFSKYAGLAVRLMFEESSAEYYERHRGDVGDFGVPVCQ